MIMDYNNYLNENIDNTKYNVYCEITERYLLEITKESDIDKAISSEINNINSFELINITKEKTNHYILTLELNDIIYKNTETDNDIKAIGLEFNWLDQSGIRVEKIIKL